MTNTQHETHEPEATIIDDPSYIEVAEYFDPCPPLDELVSPEVADRLSEDEENLS